MNAAELYQAIGEVKLEYLQESESSTKILKYRTIPRMVLIAAAIVVLCVVTVLAVVYSLREAARADMGILQENPISEWTEYEETVNNKTEYMEGQSSNTEIKVVATMCSGERVDAYIAVSPVDTEIAQACADGRNDTWHWQFGGNKEFVSYYVEQTAYDEETKTALVKLHMEGEELKNVSQVERSVWLEYSDFENGMTYLENGNISVESIREKIGMVTIPITSSKMLSCTTDITVENKKSHLIGLEREGINGKDLPDYSWEGKITQISICAGYIEVTVKTPSYENWVPQTGLNEIKIEISPEEQEFANKHGWGNWNPKEDFIQRQFLESWYRSVDEVLTGAVLHYKDGTSQLIEEIPSSIAGVWGWSDGSFLDSHPAWRGELKFRNFPQKAFDLRTVESITVGDATYSFPEISG